MALEKNPRNDFIVKVDDIVVVVPSKETPKERLFLSNIDQTVAFPVETTYFYRAMPNLDPKALIDRLQIALSELLVPYYPLAGRVKYNTDQERLEIDCNANGVLLASAFSDLYMDDLGEIGFVNPGYKNFILAPIDQVVDPPIVTIQITIFKCGGFVFGLYTSHILLDGTSTVHFLHNLAAMANGESIIYNPTFDRECLKVRDPPRITYSHPELMPVPSFPNSFTQREKSFSHVVSEISHQHTYRSFHFPYNKLQKLKERATRDGEKCSTFDAILAHVWQARVKSIETIDMDQPSLVLFAMDIRKHTKPPLSKYFTGNGVVTAYAQALACEIVSKPLSFCAEKVREGIERVTSDYVSSTIDWLEVHRGVPSVGVNGNFYLSAWWKLPFHKLDFGWGNPLYAGPVMGSAVDIVLIVSDCLEDEGVNLLIALQPHEMSKFEKHIQI